MAAIYIVVMNDGPYGRITASQREFLTARGASLDNRGWLVDWRSNLFTPLHPDSAREFRRVGELTTKSGGRLGAPHSSTVLAVNSFDIWRQEGVEGLAPILGFDIDAVVGYEHCHNFGFPRPAQPDIEFRLSDGTVLAIEVKLREPYDHERYTNSFADRYFESPGLWDELPSLARLAETIREDALFHSTLHSAQLIKHALGLQSTYDSDFILGYLWLRVPGDLGDRHADELTQFTAVAEEDIAFASWTVGDLLRCAASNHLAPDWLTYMHDRYCAEALWDDEHSCDLRME